MLAQPLLQHPHQIAGSTQQVRAKPSHRLLHDDDTLSIRLRHCQTPALRQSDYQQQQEQEQEQRVDGEWLHEPAEYNLPPGRRYTQAWKTKRPTRKPRLLDAPRDPRDSQWGTTKAQRRAALQQQLQQQYGPNAGDRDVRLYLKKRSLNEERPTGTRRGGLPLDDSLDQPGTFLKLGPGFQRTVLLERVDALVSTLPQLSPSSAWRLYTTTPGLLVWPTLQVAQHLTGLAHAAGLNKQATVDYCCTFRPFALLAPSAVLSRVGLLAKVARLSSAAAVVVMQQHPALWLISSKMLAPRVEQLSLLCHCCPVTSLRLLGSCPELLTAPTAILQQQLATLAHILGAGRQQPERVVPLLLAQPGLLLGHRGTMQQLCLQQLSHGQQQQSHEEQQQHLQQPTSLWQQQQQQGDAISLTPAEAVQQQLAILSSSLGLSLRLVHELVLRAPDLLVLAAQGEAAVAAAADTLAASWLVAGSRDHQPAAADAGAGAAAAASAAAGADAGVAQRQQYQHELLQLLRPEQHSKGMQRRAIGGQSNGSAGAVVWYDAAAAVERASLSCQWWSHTQQHQAQVQVQGAGCVQLPGLQQLVLQAPALLVLAAAQTQQGQPASHPSSTSATQPPTDPLIQFHTQSDTQHYPGQVPTGLGNAGATSSSLARMYVADLGLGSGGLAGRLQALCDKLMPLLEEDGNQQQQQLVRVQDLQQRHEQVRPAGSSSVQQGMQPQQQGRKTRSSQSSQQQQQQHQQQQQLLLDLARVAVLEPCLLVQPPGWVYCQLKQLAGALQVTPCAMLSLFLQHPAILWLTQAQVFEQVRVLCGVLKLPAQGVKRTVAQPDAVQLLLMHPEGVKKGFVAAAKAAGGEASVRALLRQQPAALLPGRQGRLRKSVRTQP